MKIKDIVTEDVDMGFMTDIDRDYNPQHLEYIQKQEQRQDLINKKFSGGTAVFKKPIRHSQKSFSNIPPKDEPKSAGYAGLVDVNVRAGHITNDEAQKLAGED